MPTPYGVGSAMLQFQKLEKENIGKIKRYFAAQKTHIADFSVGFQYMWNKSLSPEFAEFCGCLILRERYQGKLYFHYPLSLAGSEEEELRAVTEIERFCRDEEERLHFTNVPQDKLFSLVKRYGTDVRITDPRRWRDYLYPVEAFRTYAGGKYAGQRNHANKFAKTYPDWKFRAMKEEDIPAVTEFLKEYEAVQLRKKSHFAQEEMEEVYEFLPRIIPYGLYAGILTVGEKIAAFTVGERCGDMMVVHIEKALRDYEGAYPFIARQFALDFCGEGVTYLNRMDDAGDLGLRKSKLQYLPCEIVSKYTVIPHRAIDGVAHLPEYSTERLTVAPVAEEDGEAYARLASDPMRNRYWGYDYKEDFSEEGTPSAEWFLNLAKEDFHRRSEMPEGIYCSGKLIGEIVLHRFGYRSEAEVGVRLFPEYEGKGYATEAVKGAVAFAFAKLGIERMEAKCFRENAKSERMLLSAGMRPCGEDEKYLYFYKTPEM